MGVGMALLEATPWGCPHSTVSSLFPTLGASVPLRVGEEVSLPCRRPSLEGLGLTRWAEVGPMAGGGLGKEGENGWRRPCT